MTVIIPGSPQAVEIGLRQLARELALEVLTGMKISRGYSPLAFAKSLGFTGRTRLDAIVWLIEEKQVDPRGMRGVMSVLEKASLVLEEVPLP